MNHFPEERESLWVLTISPTVWAGHFLLSYITAAVWCAKVVGRDGSLLTARWAILVYTVVAIAVIGVTGYRGYRKVNAGLKEPPLDKDTPRHRFRFLGFATLLLSILSAIAVLYAGLVIVFMETCT